GSSGSTGQTQTQGTTGHGTTGKVDFSKLDQDGNGHISEQEAAAYPNLAVHFQSLDADSNGKLDEAEFAQFETMEGGASGSMEHGTGGAMEQDKDSGS
ncbi:MAG: hypothetical protein L0H63_12190, partial [Nitrococcus sp.]|nr:hypothetical protein [Nitrococcus sp.]